MSLQQLLDRIAETAQDDRVSWGVVLDTLGRRSFGPLLLVAGLAILAPLIGDIPGVPTIMGMVVFLTSVQLLFGRKQFWLPRFLRDRSVDPNKLRRATQWLKRPARFIDRLLRPRLMGRLEGAITYAIAAVSLGVAAIIPMMEFVPFSANIAGAVFTAYGLSLVARDGLLALITFVCTSGAIGVAAYQLL